MKLSINIISFFVFASIHIYTPNAMEVEGSFQTSNRMECEDPVWKSLSSMIDDSPIISDLEWAQEMKVCSNIEKFVTDEEGYLPSYYSNDKTIYFSSVSYYNHLENYLVQENYDKEYAAKFRKKYQIELVNKVNLFKKIHQDEILKLYEEEYKIKLEAFIKNYGAKCIDYFRNHHAKLLKETYDKKCAEDIVAYENEQAQALEKQYQIAKEQAYAGYVMENQASLQEYCQSEKQKALKNLYNGFLKFIAINLNSLDSSKLLQKITNFTDFERRVLMGALCELSYPEVYRKCFVFHNQGITIPLY